MLDNTGTGPQSEFASTGGVVTRHRKIAILGFGRTVKDCPWQDPSWELWGMNGFHRAAEPDFGITASEDRYTLWFDMHTVEYTREYSKQTGTDGKQEAWLKEPHRFPILMLDANPEFPSVAPYPIEEVVKKLGRDYFTSTVAYALALALCAPDVAEIGCWGIDLVHSTEYGDQRPCAEYWIGRAEAAGIKITIHEESALLKQRGRYGYEPPNPLERQLREHLKTQVASLEAAIAKNQGEMERLKSQLHTDDGALQIVRTTIERLDVWNRGGKA